METPSAKVTSKGQVTVPSEIRQALAISDGDRVEFYLLRSGEVRMARRNRPISDFLGIGADHAKPVDDEQRMKDIGAAIARRGLSKRAARK